MHLSASEITTFLRCQREHHYAHVLRFRSKNPASRALRFGRVLHAGLDAWWQPGVSAIGRVDRALLRARHAAHDENLDPFDIARVDALIVGYDRKWSASDLESLGAEVAFETAIVNPDSGAISPLTLVGRIDAIARGPKGDVWVVEHKTTSDHLMLGYWPRTRLDYQCSAYLLGATALGLAPRGAIYDVINKPRIQPFTATPEHERKYRRDGQLYASQRPSDETPEEFRRRLAEQISDDSFIRGAVVRLDFDQYEAAKDLWAIAEAIVGSGRRHAPRTPDACARYGEMCDFFGVCTNTADLNDPLLFAKKEVPRD